MVVLDTIERKARPCAPNGFAGCASALLSSLTMRCLAVSLAIVPVARHAQSPSDDVPVAIAAGLSSRAEAYHPVGDVRILVIGSAGDTTVLVTNRSGEARAPLRPGVYRVVTPQPYAWGGTAYTWDVTAAVRRGMRPIRLLSGNAIAEGTAATSRPGVSRLVAPAHPPKDPQLAAVLSFLVTGAGQMYAGKPWDGLGMLLAGTGAVVLGVAGARCDAPASRYDRPTCQRMPLYGGIGVAGGLWLLSMIQAPRDAAEWNERHGLDRYSVLPVVEPTPRGGRVGLALRW